MSASVLAEHWRPGDRIVVGQATGEPVGLVAALLEWCRTSANRAGLRILPDHMTLGTADISLVQLSGNLNHPQPPVHAELVEALSFFVRPHTAARRKVQWLTYGRLRLDKLGMDGFFGSDLTHAALVVRF